MTVGFTNEDVFALKAMLDAADAQDPDTLVATALRAQTAALRWATRG